jgi:hypothetical protein
MLIAPAVQQCKRRANYPPAKVVVVARSKVVCINKESNRALLSRQQTSFSALCRTSAQLLAVCQMLWQGGLGTLSEVPIAVFAKSR